MNIELLQKVRDRIAEIPDSYYQQKWIANSPTAPCGTMACLAGEIIICAAPSVKKGVAELRKLRRDKSVSEYAEFIYGATVPRRAAELLGISEDDAYKMFANGDDWPRGFELDQDLPQREQAEVAVRYLDECIRREQVTW